MVLRLSGVRTEFGSSTIERRIHRLMDLEETEYVSVIVTIDDEEKGAITVIFSSDDGTYLDANYFKDELNAAVKEDISSAASYGWEDFWIASPDDAICTVVDDEEESVGIDEDEANALWREMSEEDRTSHLEEVLSPDGVMMQPSHERLRSPGESSIDSQLKRDLGLLDFDNVKRIDLKDVESVCWDEPFIISCAVSSEIMRKSNTLLAKGRLMSVHGEAEVRTGNRETFIDNGFTNSKPMLMKDALGQDRMIFTPANGELAKGLVQELEQFIDCLRCIDAQGFLPCKFTLTIAETGFGIGMHKHNAAMFLLLQGRKKWYMAKGSNLDSSNETHPGFYQELSSHKCVQKPGEVLFVPNDWWHEIFNLSYTVGIQGLP